MYVCIFASSSTFRIHKYASCSNECFILALIYIDRLIQRNNFLLTELNVHRVIITAILLAAKFFDDAYYNNAYYSKVGGVLVSEMNGLEVDFLFRINFSLHVPPELFEKYKAELVAHAINSGITIPQDVIPDLQLSNSNNHTPVPAQPAAVPALMQAAAPPAPTSIPPMQSHVPPYVTPSPHASHSLATTANNTTSTNAALQQQQLQHYPQLVEATRIESLSRTTNPLQQQQANTIQHSLYVAPDQNKPLFKNSSSSGTGSKLLPQQQQQQLMQRANSLPYPSHPGRCLTPQSYSAPMVSMLPAGYEEQYMVVSNQIFPLQNTLIHHNHAVETAAVYHHDQASAAYHQHSAGYANALARENNLGSLVAGHY